MMRKQNSSLMGEGQGFFDQLKEGELDLLLNFCHLSKVDKDQVILKQGDVDNREVYLIIIGKVKVELELPENNFLLAELSDGEIFGEFSLFSREERSATVWALEDSEILHIDMNQIDKMFEVHPRIAYTLVKHIADEACHKLHRRAQKQPEIQK